MLVVSPCSSSLYDPMGIGIFFFLGQGSSSLCGLIFHNDSICHYSLNFYFSYNLVGAIVFVALKCVWHHYLSRHTLHYPSWARLIMFREFLPSFPQWVQPMIVGCSHDHRKVSYIPPHSFQLWNFKGYINLLPHF